MKGSRLAVFAALGSVVVWSSTYFLYKVAFRTIDPVAFMGVRYLVVASVAWVAFARVRPLRGLDPSARRLLLVSGVFGYTLLELTFALGLQRTTATASAVMIATHPIVAVAALAIWERRRPGGREVAGLAFGFAGVVVFLGGPGIVQQARAGDLLSLGTGVSFGIYGAIVARLGERVSDRELITTALAVGGTLAAVIGLPAMLAQDWSAVAPAAWGIAAYGAFFPVVIGVFLWGWAIARRGVARTVPIGFVEPILAGALAAVFLGERPGAMQVAGAVLVIVGVASASLAPDPGEARALAEPAPR